MSAQIHEAVRVEIAKFDWTGIREGEFRFGATDVCAQGWDGDSYTYHIGRGATTSEAYARLRAEIPTGAQRKAELEKRAAKLLSEAAKIGGAS